MIERETKDEIERLVERIAGEGHIDLEAAEFFIRASVLALGAQALEKLLEDVGAGRRNKPVLCECGQRMESEGRRAKTITTVVGPVRFSRTLYICPRCGKARFPGDEILGVTTTAFSPGVQRMMARAGSRDSYKEAAEDLNLYAALKVTAKDVERVAKAVGEKVERWMAREASNAQLRAAAGLPAGDANDSASLLYISFDGTGVPMRRDELAGRKGKQKDGSARTREAKLGCVFTQTTLDEEGRPIRDPHTTSYTGAIEESGNFGYRMRGEAVRRGVSKAEKVVCLTDGAKYNMTIVKQHFPDATHIIDLYHSREKLCDTAKLILTESQRRDCEKQWLELLDQGEIEQLLKQVCERIPRSGARRKKAMRNAKYFERNTPHMRYKEFREQGLFVGSGVIEAGCKTVIGKRLKQSGMFWSKKGANSITALRCCQYSGRFEQFWEDQGT